MKRHHPRWLVVLDTMWGPGTKAPAFFHINPRNASGRKLHSLFQDIAPFITTDCAPLMGSAAHVHQPHDPAWLERNIRAHNWRGILVCGGPAQKTAEKIKLRNWWRGPLGYIPHPASRNFPNVLKHEIRGWLTIVHRFNKHRRFTP